MKKANRKIALRQLAKELAEVKGGTRATIIDTGVNAVPPEDDSDIRAQIVDLG